MEYRDCNLCGDRQEITPEALIAWEDMILVSDWILFPERKTTVSICKPETEPCLCTECYWRLKKNG